MTHERVRKTKKGSSVLEVTVYCAMSFIIVLALGLLIENLVSLTIFINSSKDYTENITLLDTKILNDLKTGTNSIRYIGGDESKGFILNGNYYDLSSTKPIDYTKLDITNYIESNYLTITTTLHNKVETRKYNVNHW